MNNRIKTIDDLKKVLEQFLTQHPRGGIFALKGDLGAGKTTFVRELIQILAHRRGVEIPRVISPSFVLHQSYPHLKPPVEHFDLYRLEGVSDADLMEIGYNDAVERTHLNQGFLFVEWPEKATHQAILQLTHTIALQLHSDGTRTISYTKV